MNKFAGLELSSLTMEYYSLRSSARKRVGVSRRVITAPQKRRYYASQYAPTLALFIIHLHYSPLQRPMHIARALCASRPPPSAADADNLARRNPPPSLNYIGWEPAPSWTHCRLLPSFA